ncbi:MAG: hypothetical protein QXD53_06860 [Candidatus Bathyarchaeia archaeon]
MKEKANIRILFSILLLVSLLSLVTFSATVYASSIGPLKAMKVMLIV